MIASRRQRAVARDGDRSEMSERPCCSIRGIGGDVRRNLSMSLGSQGGITSVHGKSPERWPEIPCDHSTSPVGEGRSGRLSVCLFMFASRKEVNDVHRAKTASILPKASRQKRQLGPRGGWNAQNAKLDRTHHPGHHWRCGTHPVGVLRRLDWLSRKNPLGLDATLSRFNRVRCRSLLVQLPTNDPSKDARRAAAEARKGVGRAARASNDLRNLS